MKMRKTILSLMTISMAASLRPDALLAGDTVVATRLKTTVLVDVGTCSWSPTWCIDSGSVGTAAAGNNSVVGVVVQVPNAGLAETAFSLGSISNPGGVTPSFVPSTACASCFSEVQPGVYRLAARPAFGNWASGSYTVLLTVATPGPDKTIVIPIDIP